MTSFINLSDLDKRLINPDLPKILVTDLPNYIERFISTEPTMIYIGVGTEFNSSPTDYSQIWKPHENQQFPLFLSDSKSKFFDKKILIILIDCALSPIPYIVSSNDNFLSNSWTKSSTNSNIFESELGVTVIGIKESIAWGNYIKYNPISFDITEIMVESCKIVNNSTSLLFYHEFTGVNSIYLYYEIEKRIPINHKKICIDITKGADLSCYFNLSNPEYYPVITLDDKDVLTYINPSKLSNQEKNHIIQQYKNFSFDKDTCPVKKFELNPLIDKDDNFILFFQIIKQDKISFDLIKNSIISLIRQFYTITNLDLYGSSMCIVKLFPDLKLRFNTGNSMFQNIETNLHLIDFLKTEKESNPQYVDYVKDVTKIKEQILLELYILLKDFLVNICVKYDINLDSVDQLISSFVTTHDKYQIIKIFDQFISSNLNI